VNISVKSGRRAAETEPEGRCAVLIARDSQEHGELYYSVITTVVYCPSLCAPRPARPVDAGFHATGEEAGKV
jgi:methylphosphotriester-DNA--protein-cysteine methyltransferase